MYVAQPLQLREGDRSKLEALTRASSVRAGLATRARIVLLAADGVANTDIAERTGTSRPTVLKWRDRYAETGVVGLDDEPRPGRAAVIDEVTVLAETLADKGKPPAHLGVTHWSTRLMAERLDRWKRAHVRPEPIAPELSESEVELFRALGYVE